MFRTTDIVLIAVMVSAAAFTYKTKHDAERQLGKVRQIEAEIEAEKDRIDVLEADWSLLTQPARLQRLAETYRSELQLEPLEPQQIGELSELPARPVEIEDLTNERLGGVASADPDGVATTGAVE